MAAPYNAELHMIAANDDASALNPPPPRPAALTFALVLLPIVIIAVVFGWPSLRGEFLDGDDLGLIKDHFLINHPSWKHAAELLGMIHGDLYQPVPMLTFMANYAIAGDDPRGYHAVNIAIHAINAMLVALLAWRLAACPRVGFLTGAMFACHPIAMEPVAWITGRIILLATMFALLTTLAFALRRETPGPAWAIGCAAAWGLSLVSKVLPSVPLAGVWCDIHLYRRHARGWWIALAVLLVETAAFTWWAYYTTQRLDYFAMMQAEATTSWPARVMLASRYYLENYIWPTRLSAWSPPPRSVPILSVPVAIGALEWLAVLGVMIVSWRRCRAAFVGIGLFILLLAPFLAAMTARTFLTADRYMYLPILGLHIACAAWIVKARRGTEPESRAAALQPAGIGRGSEICGVGYQPAPVRAGSSGPGVVGLGTLALLTVLAFWMSQAWNVARIFHDNLSQARRAIDLYPDDVRAWIELTRTHVKHAEDAILRGDADRGRWEADAALAVIAEQRQRGRDDPGLAAEAGEAHWHLRDYAVAERELRAAIAGLPRNNQAKYYLGLSLAATGRHDEARALWMQILKEKDHFLPAATALARSFRDAGQPDEAARWYERAIELNSHHREALFNLALIRMAREDWPAAESLLRRVLYVSPVDPAAMLNLAVVRVRRGDAEGALAIYDELCVIEPDNAEIRYNRAALLASMRRVREAVVAYREILRRAPNHRAAAVALHELMVAGRQFSDMVELWKSVNAAPHPPEDASAWQALAEALAARSHDAQATLDKIKPGTPGSVMAGWIAAWLALTRSPQDPKLLAAAIDAAAARPVRTNRDREGVDAVAKSLADWGREHSDDAASYYALARAMAALGPSGHAAARQFAQRATELDPAGPWGQRARRLKDELR